MFEVVYMDRRNTLQSEDVTTIADGVKRAKEILRFGATYGTYRPMVRVYDGQKMVRVIEGQINPAGQIRNARVQTPDGKWTPFTAI